MANSSLHKDANELAGVHQIHNWTFENSATRMFYAYKPYDVGKVARQLDNNSFWLLVNHSPKTFVEVGCSTLKTERYEKITIGNTDIIYLGVAVSGSVESEAVWQITKTTIVDNFPISTLVSNDNVSWNDRLSTTYS